MMYVVSSSSTWRKYYFSDLMNMAAWQAYIGIRPWVIMTKVKPPLTFSVHVSKSTTATPQLRNSVMYIHNTKVNILLTVSYLKLCELTNVTDDYISVTAIYRNSNLIL